MHERKRHKRKEIVLLKTVNIIQIHLGRFDTTMLKLNRTNTMVELTLWVLVLLSYNIVVHDDLPSYNDHIFCS